MISNSILSDAAFDVVTASREDGQAAPATLLCERR
jgi:hypothetical protein